MKRILAYGFIYTVILISLVLSADEDGGYPAAYLRLGIGTQALGMGGAVTANSLDSHAAYWNPAGLTYSRGTDLTASYGVMDLDRDYGSISISIPTKRFGTLAFHTMYYGVRDIDGRDENGQVTEEFSDDEVAFNVSYGFRLSKRFAGGLSAKYLQQRLDQYSAEGYSYNIGVLISPKPYFRLGLAVLDIAGELKWDTVNSTVENIPMITRLGIAIDPWNSPFTISADLEKVEHYDSIGYRLGAEILILDQITLRSGINDDKMNYGFTIWMDGMYVDYAFFTMNHYFSDYQHQLAISFILHQ